MVEASVLELKPGAEGELQRPLGNSSWIHLLLLCSCLWAAFPFILLPGGSLWCWPWPSVGQHPSDVGAEGALGQGSVVVSWLCSLEREKLAWLSLHRYEPHLSHQSTTTSRNREEITSPVWDRAPHLAQLPMLHPVLCPGQLRVPPRQR